MTNVMATAHGSWRDQVLKYFSPEIAGATRVTVVADPDGLLLDDAVATTLSGQGFDVVPYRDAVEFRFYYESRHRARWDDGEHSSVVVSAPWGRQDVGRLPFDVLSSAESVGRVLDVSLASIFPNLASDVLAELDPADLDTVWVAVRSVGRDTLGSNQTRDLVLRSVFKLSPEMITSDTDLIVQMLRLHHAKRSVPRLFAARFAESIGRDGRFAGWPIADLVVSPDSFFRMLQDRWERRLNELDANVPIRANRPDGPVAVDFAAPEIAAIVDNLFLEGRLSPVEVPDAPRFRGRLESCGVSGTARSESIDGARKLLETVIGQIPQPGVPPTVWTRFAQQWAELVGVADRLSTGDRSSLQATLQQAQVQVDSRLWNWLTERFGALINRAFLPAPMVVSQIPHFMAHKRRPGDKLAVVVVDGMSLSQWTAIKTATGTDWTAGLTLEEMTVFAWIPTVTSVSRQAIFSGQPPMFFEGTVHTTSAEEKHWKAFWEERGWRRDRVGYIKHRQGEHESSLVDRVQDAADSGRVESLAVVVNSIDRLVHGVGPEGNVLSAAVRQWAENGHIVSLLHCLVERGFDVAVCSDHGNVEAVGVGRPDLGSVPEDQGQRAITFPDVGTLEAARKRVAGSQPWPGPGLPSSAHVLLPPGRGSFSTAGATVRTHGGTSIEEVFVPFVRVSQST
ncbi:MAG: BREX-3 system phosphatase PglZ [Phycisphaerales bacterium]|nr:BREX-3 system phosphatase PglZ [Phycisphaerales bacterium]